MPYTPEQLTALESATPEAAKTLFDRMSPEERNQLATEYTAFKASKAKQDNWQPTQYGFKVRTGEAPTGGPATIREDGAINFPGQSNWLYFDPKTERYAPAPSEPWGNKGVLSSAVGADTLAHYGRNIKAGWDQDMSGLYDLGSQAATGLGLQSREGRAEAIRRINEGMRQSQALKNTGGSTASMAQMAGEALPVIAMAPVAEPVAAAALPEVLAPLSAPLALGASTAATTPGDIGERAKAGTIAATIGTGLPAAASKIGGGIATGARKLAAVPAVSQMLDELGSRLGGKSPGVALQDAANKVYNDAWSKFMQAITPVDEAASKAKIDYAPAIQKGKEILGIGFEREPGALTEEGEKVIRRFFDDIQKAGQPESGVSNSFKGGMNLVKRLTAAERQLAQKHGDLEARDAISAMKEAVLDSMEQSNPKLTDDFKAARQLFKQDVAPLFDKSQGGDLLTKIRDTPRPNDVLAQYNQGSLTRMKPDALRIIAKGSSPDPILYSILDAAVAQSENKPGSFATSLAKAMPGVEAIGDKQTSEAFKGMLNLAKTAKFTGWLSNLGLLKTGPAYAGGAAVLGHFAPAYSGPGIMWKVLQNNATKNLLKTAAKFGEGSPELNMIASDIIKYMSSEAGKKSVEKNADLENAYKLEQPE